jgi:leucyl-tRNA synthetase
VRCAGVDPTRPRYWQDAWRQAGLATGRRDPGRRKFYALNAYPGPSGFFHVGHLRAYAYLDAAGRYQRMRGAAVLLPFGVHASGLPAVAWAQRVHDRHPATIAQLDEAGVSPADRAAMEAPEHVAQFFLASYRAAIEQLGVLIDPATLLTTVDDDYRAFIRWQFNALARKDALVQAEHYASVCPVCGPVAVDLAETDLSSGGDAEVTRYTTVPFPLEDGRILLAATLRPETVYGVTNLWLARGSELVVWHHGERMFLVTRPGAERLVEQQGGRIGQSVPSSEIVGRTVTVPLAGRTVPVFASAVVDPAVGTGVVMSVPAHAPADAAALLDLTAEERGSLALPAPVLLQVGAESSLSASEAELLQGPGTPAEKALRAVGARSLADRERIDEATERLYRLEFVRGTMTVPTLSGVRVRDARERVAEELAAHAPSGTLQEFSKPVVCRNGHTVVIRRLDHQWFLRYSDPAWKAATVQAVSELRTVPEEYVRELPGIIDWFEDRPCTRQGRWLGTPFPLDPAWTIEPIADSTFYMAYFVVRRFVATGRLSLPQLTDAFFDRVFLGEGPGEPTVPAALADEVRSEFLYWYPLDVNFGGKEHKRVHFPVFLYTHAKLLSPELQPLGILVNGWITGPTGEKLSKKDVAAKGGRIPPIAAAYDQWGPDALRLFYVISSSTGQDLEFDPALVEAAVGRLNEVERLVREAFGSGDGVPELDAWLLSRAHELIGRVRAAFDALDFRAAAEATFVEMPTILRRYYTRGGVAGTATDTFARIWVRLLAPIAPHLAEELGSGKFEGLVATAKFPDPDELNRSPVAEAREAFLERVEEDLRSVLRPMEDRGEPLPEEMLFYVAAPWKARIEEWLREAIDRGETPTIRTVMERAQHHPEVAAARAEIPRYVERFLPSLRSEPTPLPPVDELDTLRAAAGYVARRFRINAVRIFPESEAAPHDPRGRRERARPGRPAFYLVRPGEPAGPRG